jgi:hypothetical protein
MQLPGLRQARDACADVLRRRSDHGLSGSDQHAEAEMRNLQEAGLFTQTRWDGTKVDCTVNQLTNGPLEDGYGHKQTKYDSLGVRVGMDTNFCEELKQSGSFTSAQRWPQPYLGAPAAYAKPLVSAPRSAPVRS